MNAIEKQITRKIVEACDAVDECWLFVKTGWVYLIWDNGLHQRPHC